MRSAPRRLDLPGEGSGTNWRGARRGSKVEAKQASCRTVAHECSWATGERQEHLDAAVSFAGAGQRRRLFRRLDTLTIKWATGDLLEECRFLLNTGSLSGPLARTKVDEKNCFGMIEWRTRQQQRGNIETCLMLNKKGSRQC